ncbi:uncharacterized protein Z518_01525 [Rhinocladiella mackenziei CBS 650.93]|uniref:Uncharacterized protein n=1 Tax=Rhinocladiella mackenziei CBS 650.93 TaxID=1442369 RepID=A0A0D2HIE3_9EURO|nr:uncharacterized protein Z518_01525 [Rhinocladiella mackenziei CBS 650.93]KIX10443.1 hypothetical protein Z518_01525 [Rhinocladiella mackenziei CBS 650.93]
MSIARLTTQNVQTPSVRCPKAILFLTLELSRRRFGEKILKNPKLAATDNEEDRRSFQANVSLEGYPDHVPLGSHVLCVVMERFHNHANGNRGADLVLQSERRDELSVDHWYRIVKNL